MGKQCIWSRTASLIQQCYHLLKHKIHTIFSHNQDNTHKHNTSLTTQPANKRKIITKTQIRKLCTKKLSRNKQNKLHKQTVQKQQYEKRKLGKQMKHEDEITKQKNFQTYLMHNSEDMMCSICRSQLLDPVATPCDHVFCLPCIQNSLLNASKCPLCRHSITSQEHYGLRIDHSIIALAKLQIQKLFSKYKTTCSQDYAERLQEHKVWRAKRFISLQNNIKIDVWKLDINEWRAAIVKDIDYSQQGNQLSVLVHYGKVAQDQIIELPSLRIAAHQFYSKRNDKNQLTLTTFRLSNFNSERFNFAYNRPWRRLNFENIEPRTTHPFLGVNNHYLSLIRLPLNRAEPNNHFPSSNQAIIQQSINRQQVGSPFIQIDHDELNQEEEPNQIHNSYFQNSLLELQRLSPQSSLFQPDENINIEDYLYNLNPQQNLQQQVSSTQQPRIEQAQ